MSVFLGQWALHRSYGQWVKSVLYTVTPPREGDPLFLFAVRKKCKPLHHHHHSHSLAEYEQCSLQELVICYGTRA